MTSKTHVQANSDSNSGICDRTQQVREAILDKLADGSDCANVTDANLVGITGDLSLSNESISALKDGDFQGLSCLEQLYLNNNLSELPDGIFAGLESLDNLWLNFDPGAPFSHTMTLEQEDSDSVVVKVAEGVPFDTPVTLAAEGGTLSSTTVSIAGGELESDVIGVMPSGNGEVTVSVSAPTILSDYFGVSGSGGDDLMLAAVDLSSSGNTVAAGAPSISGTAQVGETLTADTSGITDADGIDNDSYSYQWIRSSGSTDRPIDGATESTCELGRYVAIKTIKVRVSFTDDAGYYESLTSEAPSAVEVGG